MSSRILDAARIPSEPVRWKRVGATENAGRPAPAAEAPDNPKPPVSAERAREEAQRMEEAHRRGFVEGEARGRQAATQQFQAAVERLARSAAEMVALRPQVRRECEEDTVTLALAVARRILRRELTVDPATILGLVKAAAAKLDLQDLQRIRAHPETAVLLARRLQDAGLPEKVEVVPDAQLEPGAAILETTRGALDASVEAQLREIERGFADLMAGG
ncbi:MAG TPA: FliH/SctL family protein [Bryobacteraceae bacterium]|jgi:flagellar assembly protein FliH|nr:FliH/SctL family protein [Bryobacteraceae bacterium]